MTQDLSQQDISRIAAEVIRQQAERFSSRNPPTDLVYQPGSKTYFSPSTGLYFAKGAPGRLVDITRAEYDARNGLE